MIVLLYLIVEKYGYDDDFDLNYLGCNPSFSTDLGVRSLGVPIDFDDWKNF